jgi:hypothetical protein
MTKVFRRIITGYKYTYSVANAIEGFDDCDIISINNLGNNQWEIWARFHQKYSYGMEDVNAEIEECIKYFYED